jgi:hypothetical protein
MRFTVEEIDSSISIDQISAVRLRPDGSSSSPAPSRLGGVAIRVKCYLMADRGDGYYEQFGLITKILAVR